MNFDCSLPVKATFKSVDELKDALKNFFSGAKIGLLLSETAERRLGLNDAINALKEKNRVSHVKRIPPNPTQFDVCTMLDTIGREKPDTLLCIGGGSVIDSGKAISLFHHHYCEKKNFNADEVLRLLQTKDYLKTPSSIPVIAVPTTAGSGSEATRWATIWDMSGKTKYSIEAEWLYPEQAWIVPETTLHMPARLTLSTGLDALCQATESYWSKNSNQISREFSLTAISLITQNLPAVLKHPQNLELRHKMCLGSLFSAFAFSNTRTTACHSISYPLTMLFGVEHGFAAAVTLFSIAKINFETIVDVPRFVQAWGVEEFDQIKNWIDSACADIQPLTLSAFGIQEQDIEAIVDLAFTQGRMDNNPVCIDRGLLTKTLQSLF
jgi:alcohol dehydrogenase class IV